MQVHHFILIAGAWSLINGILHDIFVLAKKMKWEKELIRLMIDGHILIFSGIIYLLCYSGIEKQEAGFYYIAFANAIFILGYCALIYKMLPSILTILINMIAAVWLGLEYFNAIY